jgi:hypothetical protein
MRYRFVAAEQASGPARLLCRVVGAVASGFHAWRQRRPRRRERQDRSLAERVTAVLAANRRTCGSPQVSRKRVARLMLAPPFRRQLLDAGPGL